MKRLMSRMRRGRDMSSSKIVSRATFSLSFVCHVCALDPVDTMVNVASTTVTNETPTAMDGIPRESLKTGIGFVDDAPLAVEFIG